METTRRGLATLEEPSLGMRTNSRILETGRLHSGSQLNLWETWERQSLGRVPDQNCCGSWRLFLEWRARTRWVLLQGPWSASHPALLTRQDSCSLTVQPEVWASGPREGPPALPPRLSQSFCSQCDGIPDLGGFLLTLSTPVREWWKCFWRIERSHWTLTVWQF